LILQFQLRQNRDVDLVHNVIAQILVAVLAVVVIGGIRVVGKMDVLQVKCLKKEVVMLLVTVKLVFVVVNIDV